MVNIGRMNQESSLAALMESKDKFEAFLKGGKGIAKGRTGLSEEDEQTLGQKTEAE